MRLQFYTNHSFPVCEENLDKGITMFSETLYKVTERESFAATPTIVDKCWFARSVDPAWQNSNCLSCFSRSTDVTAKSRGRITRCICNFQPLPAKAPSNVPPLSEHPKPCSYHHNITTARPHSKGCETTSPHCRTQPAQQSSSYHSCCATSACQILRRQPFLSVVV